MGKIQLFNRRDKQKNYIDLIKETDKVKPKEDNQFKFYILEILPNKTLI